MLEKGPITLLPNDLLIYIDETGSESLSDPNYPLFGLGGCAIDGSNYLLALEKPWKQLKAKHFGGSEVPLHASGLDLSNKAGIAAVGAFFRESPIARFATIFDPATAILPPGTDLYLAMSLVLHKQIAKLTHAFRYYRFVLMFEDSSRGNSLAIQYYSEVQPVLEGPDSPFRAPVLRCFAAKSLAHPGLEFADFVVHAAGRQALLRFRQRHTLRKDFEVVLAPNPNRFAEVSFATQVTVSQR